MTKILEATTFFRREAEGLGITGPAVSLYAREKVREWMEGQIEIPAEMRTVKFTNRVHPRGDADEPE